MNALLPWSFLQANDTKPKRSSEHLLSPTGEDSKSFSRYDIQYNNFMQDFPNSMEGEEGKSFLRYLLVFGQKHGKHKEVLELFNRCGSTESLPPDAAASVLKVSTNQLSTNVS